MSGAPTRRSSIGWLVVGAGVVPALVWVIGIATAQALLLVAVGALTVAVARFRPSAFEVAWPPPAVLAPDRGVRREIARLSWSVGRGSDSQVGATSVHRLQEVARRRLARAGLDLDDPADTERGRALLGDGPWRVLTATRGAVRVSPAAFRTAVVAVERLGNAPARPTPAPAASVLAASAPDAPERAAPVPASRSRPSPTARGDR